MAVLRPGERCFEREHAGRSRQTLPRWLCPAGSAGSAARVRNHTRPHSLPLLPAAVPAPDSPAPRPFVANTPRRSSIPALTQSHIAIYSPIHLPSSALSPSPPIGLLDALTPLPQRITWWEARALGVAMGAIAASRDQYTRRHSSRTRTASSHDSCTRKTRTEVPRSSASTHSPSRPATLQRLGSISLCGSTFGHMCDECMCNTYM